MDIYDTLLESASKCYNFEIDNITSINSGSNKVYRIHKDGKNYYLRISTRELSYIEAEIDWITFLKDIINVPVLVKSNNNKSIEAFNKDGKNYVFCVFHELAGEFWDKNDSEKWNETVFYNWGNTMGKMHHMTQNYHPPAGSLKRPSFEDNLVSLDSYKNIPSVYEKMKRIEHEISVLPQDSGSYGLIHSDMHQQNLLINNYGISTLDFDDCQYGFFALDIGIALYHAIWWGLPDDDSKKNEAALKIIKNFMMGYNAENPLSDFWLKKILMFMQYRQIDALSWHINYFKPQKNDEIVFNDCFKIYYDFGKHVKYIENDIFYENCKIDESDFLNIAK